MSSSEEEDQMKLYNESAEKSINKPNRISLDKKVISSPDRNQKNQNDSMSSMLFSLQAMEQEDDSMSRTIDHDTSHTNNEELRILSDLETTGVFKMRDEIKHYILNNIQLERKGLNLKIND